VRKRRLREPAHLEALRQGAARVTGMLSGTVDFPQMQVSEVFCTENAAYRGRLVGEIARMENKDPFEKFIEITLADDLRTSFTISFVPDTHDMFVERAKLWTHPGTVIGGGDAGAHLDMIDTFAISTELLGTGVREHKVISLEQAVHQLTLKPARFMGLKNRGKLEVGMCADIVVFDPDRIGAGDTHMRRDLPAGGMRLYADALGINRVIVNGKEIIQDGVYLGRPAGTILRPGKSIETVPIPADVHRDPDTAQVAF
jgi:N-acyl-D-aspartate/D-glutamate deacylase